jgi:2-(1,2-epoxy-1,2-dihydrophenyl)acetyl-CoA isomerase
MSSAAMSAPSVQVETHGAVALVTLNRPDHSNTLNLQMAMDLLAAAMACARDAAVRAVVLTGAGRNFSFGGDLRAMPPREQSLDGHIRELTTYLHAAISHFVRMDAPVIAAVNGTAAGAGVGLAAMADLALCARSSKFNLAYTSVGLTPDAGTTFLLPRAVGHKRAMELLLLNRALGAAEALAWGLVNEVVDDAALLGRALELAERLAHGPVSAFGATKRLVAHSLAGLESQLVLESEAIAAQAGGPDATEGIAAFLAKRTPRFPGSAA